MLLAYRAHVRRLLPLRAALLAFVVALTSHSAARADEPGSSAYDVALDRSLAAHAHGDFVAAEAAMREAHALEPNARTFRALGILAYERGAYPEALLELEAALATPTRALTSELRASVEALHERISLSVSRITLFVQPASAHVLLDDAPPVRASQGELLVRHGAHTLTLEAAGHEPHRLAFQAGPDAAHTLHVVLAKRSADAAPAAVPLVPAQGKRIESAQAPRREPPARWRHALRNGLLGGGGALLAAGASTWLVGYRRFRDLSDRCSAQESGGCGEELARERFDSARIGELTTTGAVLASVGAASLLAGCGIALFERVERHHLEFRAHARGLVLRASF